MRIHGLILLLPIYYMMCCYKNGYPYSMFITTSYGETMNINTTRKCTDMDAHQNQIIQTMDITLVAHQNELKLVLIDDMYSHIAHFFIKYQIA